MPAGGSGPCCGPRCATASTSCGSRDLTEPDDLVAPETFVAADLTDRRRCRPPSTASTPSCTSARCPTESSFEAIAGPNLHGAFHVFEACRRAGVRRVVFASSNHATGMYAPGEPLDGAQPPRPDGLYGASKVWGEALGRLYVDRSGSSVVCLRIGSFQPRPRERRELATWLSHADGSVSSRPR